MGSLRLDDLGIKPTLVGAKWSTQRCMPCVAAVQCIGKATPAGIDKPICIAKALISLAATVLIVSIVPNGIYTTA